MENIELIQTILKLLKDYDAINVIVVLVIYQLLDKRIRIVDKAVNHRPIGTLTLSEEVTEINHKVDLFRQDLTHVKKEIDAHRAVDEVAFTRIEKDIRTLAQKI